ncbi:hypothetical protein GCM10022403_071970 [Streptomyces coacervatus]|uniref:Luciferase-like domain-containing protein n=1 Tax=Streptomyces coacervatus TaxID=647381 RepID=A0ABP7IWB8_9ACTN|nr:LLM class flavin-dependent oxidoreductase [Streptomyces coacervatus]MDF2269680.1 LLM class flavin-dependent oxidoreductase [Streptomyces coacervatus]
MLPNHAPFVVAEQCALLEAAFPGRIDLGLGRAPGGDPGTVFALRADPALAREATARFPEHIEHLMPMLEPEGAAIRLGGQTFRLKGTWQAGSVPAT